VLELIHCQQLLHITCAPQAPSTHIICPAPEGSSTLVASYASTPCWNQNEQDDDVDDAWNPKSHIADEDPSIWGKDVYSELITFP
jgi:hypothetical protein